MVTSSESVSSASGMTPRPIGEAGAGFYQWPAQQSVSSTLSTERRHMAINLDLISDDEPLNLDIHLSSINSRLSLSQANVISSESQIGVSEAPEYDSEYHRELTDDNPYFSASSRSISPFSSSEYHPFFSSPDSNNFMDPLFVTILYSGHFQMIHDLEASQSIDLSHLASLTGSTDQEDLSQTDMFVSEIRDSSNRLEFSHQFLSMSEWLLFSVSQTRSSRHRSIDEVLESHGGFPPPKSDTPRVERSRTDLGPTSTEELSGWRRLQSFFRRCLSA